jgi:prepilin-type N-terminal cleavage/methylation domain-containing protein
MNTQKLQKNTQAGFTLVEVLVSLAIFSIVVVSALGAMLAISDANRRVQQTRSVMDNLSLAIESISRNLRLGYMYHCAVYTSTPGVIPRTAAQMETSANCTSPNYGNFISFWDQYREPTVPTEYASYYYLREFPDPSDLVDGKRGVIMYKNYTTPAGDPGVALTSPDIDVQNLRFYVLGANPSEKNNKQPRVIIVISGKTQIGKAQEPVEINIQTTVTQRSLNI